MYLARTFENGKLRYRIRKSYFDADFGIYRHAEIFDLGSDPRRFMDQPARNVVCFAEELEKAAAAASGEDPTPLLEKLLLKFLPLEVRRIVEQFQRGNSRRLSPLSPEEKAEVERSIHLFDRRRMYYIRYGAVDQRRLFRLSDKLYRPLLFKSRDEKEHYIRSMETALRPDEVKKYIFVIFNLQQEFRESYAAFMPEALDEEKMADIFVDKLCRLNDDVIFWQGEEETRFLREHLRRYLVSFFDSEFAARSYAYDFYKNFRSRHRKFSWPEPKRAISEEETVAIFGLKTAELKKLNLQELTRLFRRKAKEHHPDSGGNAESFVKLLAAFEELKKRFGKK